MPNLNIPATATVVAVIGAIVCGGWWSPSTAVAQDGGAAPADLVRPTDAEVTAVLDTYCARCHTEAAEEPGGDFDFIMKLEMLKADPFYVSPGNPAQSELTALIRAGEMPPEDDDGPKPSEAEIQLLENWIIALAHPLPDTTGTGTGATGGDGTTSATGTPGGPDNEPSFDLMEWLGRFHVMVIHFPIALAMAALLAESFSLRKKALEKISDAARFCIWIGALGAIAATAVGWMNYLSHTWVGARLELVDSHRIGGTVSAILAVITVALCEWSIRRPDSAGRRWAFRVLLLLTAGIIAASAHGGGQVVHGPGSLPF